MGNSPEEILLSLEKYVKMQIEIFCDDILGWN